jgi:hypothetical protein
MTRILIVLNVLVWGLIFPLLRAFPSIPHGPLSGDGSSAPLQRTCLSPEKYGGDLIAVTQESERKTGEALHGDIFLNGTCYHFTTGGVTTSAPFGVYQIGGGICRPYLNTLNKRHIAYPVSDAFDPVLKRKRDALFIHPARRTEGCIGIDPRQWQSFEKDMDIVKPKRLKLVPSGKAWDA